MKKKNDYIDALSTLQQAYNRYEQALDQLNTAEKSNPLLNKNIRTTEKNLSQLDMLNAILEKKFFLCEPERYSVRMSKFTSKNSKIQYKTWIPNGKNMKCVYNSYPIKWTNPPKPWLPYKVKYKVNSNHLELI